MLLTTDMPESSHIGVFDANGDTIQGLLSYDTDTRKAIQYVRFETPLEVEGGDRLFGRIEEIELPEGTHLALYVGPGVVTRIEGEITTKRLTLLLAGLDLLTTALVQS